MIYDFPVLWYSHAVCYRAPARDAARGRKAGHTDEKRNVPNKGEPVGTKKKYQCVLFILANQAKILPGVLHSHLGKVWFPKYGKLAMQVYTDYGQKLSAPDNWCRELCFCSLLIRSSIMGCLQIL